MTRAHLRFDAFRIVGPAPTYAPPPGRSPPSWTRAMRAFVDQFLVECVSASDEAHVLLELSAAVSGPEIANAIGERLLATLGSAEFEAELRRGPDMAHVRLRRINGLLIRIEASPLHSDTRARAAADLKRVEDLIRADATPA